MKNSLKLGKASLHRPHVDQKFWRNHSVALFLEIQAFFVLCNLCKKFKMVTIFDRSKFFGKLDQLLSRVTLWVKNFAEINVCSSVFEIQAFFKKINLNIQNGRHFWQVRYSLKLGKARLHRYRGSKILAKSLYVALFSRYKYFLCLASFAKISKIPSGRHFFQDKFFFFSKIGSATQQSYPVSQIFHQNRSV